MNFKTKRASVTEYYWMLILLFFLAACDDKERRDTGASNIPVFDKTFQLGSSSYGLDIVEKRSGGFYAIGTTDGRSVVLSLDEHGDSLWTWWGNAPGVAVAETPDGGSLIAERGRIVRLSSGGAELNATKFGIDNIGDIIPGDAEGTYIIHAMFQSPNFPVFSGFSEVSKISADLETIWKKHYDEKYFSISKLTGAYALSLRAAYLEPQDFSLSIMDGNGAIMTAYSYGDSDVEYVFDIYEMSDGGVLLAGAFSWASNHSYLIRTNTFGEVLWEREYYNGVHDTAVGAIEMSNEDIIFVKTGAAHVEQSNTWPGTYPIYSDERIYLLRLNKNGDPLYNIEFSEDADQYLIRPKLIKTNKGYAVFMCLNGAFRIIEYFE